METTSSNGLQVHLFCLQALRARALQPCEEELLVVAGVRSASRRTEIVQGRAALRALLADVTGCEPDDLRLQRDERGKPSAVLANGQPVPSFNVSHSNGVLAIALAMGKQAVGVDVEGPAAGLAPDVEAIARSQFSPAERAEVLGAAPGEQLATFMRIWTLKEAVLKATGLGLSHPLRTVQVAGRADTVHCELGASRTAVKARHIPLAPAWHLAVARCGELPPVSLHWMTHLSGMGGASHAHDARHTCPACQPLAAAAPGWSAPAPAREAAFA